MWVGIETSIGYFEGGCTRNIFESIYNYCYENNVTAGEVWIDEILVELANKPHKNICKRIVDLLNLKLEAKLSRLSEDKKHHGFSYE